MDLFSQATGLGIPIGVGGPIFPRSGKGLRINLWEARFRMNREGWNALVLEGTTGDELKPWCGALPDRKPGEPPFFGTGY